MKRQVGFSKQRRRPRIGTIIVVILAHLAALYGLARAFAPDATIAAQESVVAAVTVTVTAPDDPVPDENEPVPDEGAQGDPGQDAVPKPVTAPEKPLPSPSPLPRASSTGAASSAGATDGGTGTGAAGSGLGTGSGREGGGRGGIAVTRPVHISGGIDNARDYPVPEGGRQARRGTEVIVKMTVGIDGRASNCSIFRPSPDPEADRITCRLVVERLRFRPATDSRGNPVAAPYYWRQRWF